MSELPTATELMQKVRDLADQYPRGRYLSPSGIGGACFYNKGEIDLGPATEGCIMGQAFTALGLEVGKHHEQRPVAEVAFDLGLRLDTSEADWLGLVQHFQDLGKPWAEAVELADKRRIES